jgi:hypothetical protein
MKFTIPFEKTTSRFKTHLPRRHSAPSDMNKHFIPMTRAALINMNAQAL